MNACVFLATVICAVAIYFHIVLVRDTGKGWF